jgi:hypothetical protein
MEQDEPKKPETWREKLARLTAGAPEDFGDGVAPTKHVEEPPWQFWVTLLVVGTVVLGGMLWMGPPRQSPVTPESARSPR